MDSPNTKAEIRARIIAGREALPQALRCEWCAAITERLLALEGYRNARTVAAYASFRAEFNTAGFIASALAAGKRVALACDPASGLVTANTLGNYLYNNMKAFLKAEDLSDPGVPKEPNLEYDNNLTNALVFAQVPVPQYPVAISLPANTAGKQVDVLNDKLQKVVSNLASPPVWQLQLKRGTYLAQILELGLQTPAFPVNGTGAVNV